MNLKGMEHFFKVFDMLGSTGTYGYDGTEYIKPLPLIVVDIARLGISGALKTDHDLTIKDVCYAFVAWIFHKNGRDEVSEEEFFNAIQNLFRDGLESNISEMIVCNANMEAKTE